MIRVFAFLPARPNDSTKITEDRHVFLPTLKQVETRQDALKKNKIEGQHKQEEELRKSRFN